LRLSQRRSAFTDTSLKDQRPLTAVLNRKFQKRTNRPRSKHRLYSISSSASVSTFVGILRPSALAVAMLMTRSIVVASSTGILAGVAPLRIRPSASPYEEIFEGDVLRDAFAKGRIFRGPPMRASRFFGKYPTTGLPNQSYLDWSDACWRKVGEM